MYSSVPVFIVCVGISAIIWFLFARVMTAKTLKGSRIHTEVLGFQEFMNRVDGERLKTMPPDTFEKFLPCNNCILRVGIKCSSVTSDVSVTSLANFSLSSFLTGV